MISNKKILAVIPARGGSKGVPAKNIRNLHGNPLISYIVGAAGRSQYIDRLIVSTDEDDYIKVCRKIGVEIAFKRPPALATDRTPLIAVIIHAFKYFLEQGLEYDAVLSLQPTCPFITMKTIDAMIELWDERNCESVTTVAEIVNGHPYIAKRFLDDHAIEAFCVLPENMTVGSRQEREKAFYLTGGVYLRDKKLLHRAEPKGHCLGNDSRAIVVSQYEAVDIDSEMDFSFAEFLLHSGYIKHENTSL